MKCYLKNIIIYVMFLTLETSPVQANVVGSDAQNFNPTTSGLDFVTVQSAQTLEPAIFNLGLFLNYAVNSLPVSDSGEREFAITDTLLMIDMNAGLGLMSGWDVGISYPRLLRQAIDTKDSRGQFKQTGNTEVRLNSKFRLLKLPQFGAALVLSTNINRMENNPYVGKNSAPTLNTELVFSGAVNSYSWAVNLGYRAKRPGERVGGTAIRPTRDQVIGSFALSRLIDSIDTKVVTEVFGSRASKNGVGKTLSRQAAAIESLVGIKSDLNTNLSLHLGGGTELFEGVSSPDWRLYSGLNFASGPIWNNNRSAIFKPIKPQPRTPLQGDETAAPAAADITLKWESPDGGDHLDIKNSERIPVFPGEVKLVTSAVNFAFDSATKLTPGSEEALGGLTRYLRRPPVFSKLTIEGHTDSVGRSEYNMKLSLERAAAIKEILVQTMGLPASKIFVIGFGESKPVADNGNYQGRQKNRRVEFRIGR